MAEPPRRAVDDHAVALAAARLAPLLGTGQSLSASMPAPSRRMSLPAQPTAPPRDTCVPPHPASSISN